MAQKTIKSSGYNNGYNDAINAIKQMMNGGGSEEGSGSGGFKPDPRLEMPDMQGQSNEQGKGGTGQGEGGTGIVNPEDCKPIEGIGSIPKEPGSMCDSKTGDKIAKEEGYDPLGGSDSAIEKEWKDATMKAKGKLKGTDAGSFISKLDEIYKVSHDWKKELKKIVGMSITPEDKRQAYAHKNTLVSQDRIARTDKDKYDTLDYMMVWVDSSGSMTDEMLRKCLSEVYYVALAKKPIKLVVVQCDTQITDIKEYTNLKQLKTDIIHATVKGRGGTELKPCWDLLKYNNKYKRRPSDLVMIFTDGYLNQYKRDPRTMKNLCWVIIDNPSFDVQYNDVNTKVVHIKSNDIR